jgi:hypothetical protein
MRSSESIERGRGVPELYYRAGIDRDEQHMLPNSFQPRLQDSADHGVVVRDNDAAVLGGSHRDGSYSITTGCFDATRPIVQSGP